VLASVLMLWRARRALTLAFLSHTRTISYFPMSRPSYIQWRNERCPTLSRSGRKPSLLYVSLSDSVLEALSAAS